MNLNFPAVRSDLIRLNSSVLSGEAAVPCGSDLQPASQRLPGPHQDAQTDLRTAGVHPWHPEAQQKPDRCSALPQEEAGLHSEPGDGDPKTGTGLKNTHLA